MTATRMITSRHDFAAQPCPYPFLTSTWGGREVQLYTEGALFLPDQSILVVADLHLGKSASFRQAGIPVPSGTTAATLTRLANLMQRTGANRLLLLGDLFHTRAGITEQLESAWLAHRRKYATVQIVLIRGNHDRYAGDVASRWGLITTDAWHEGDWMFRHEPRTVAGRWVMAGHVHPCVRIPQVGSSSTRLPCFVLGGQRAILPAFGTFTGMHPVTPERDDTVFVTTPQGVMPWLKPR